MESVFNNFEKNALKKPFHFLTPHPQKSGETFLNAKTRNKSDTSSPNEKVNIGVENLKRFVSVDTRFVIPSCKAKRTPLQTLRVSCSSETQRKTFNSSSLRKTETAEKCMEKSFNIYCDPDSNATDSCVVTEKLRCLHAVTPVVPKTKFSRRSLLKIFNGEEEKEIKGEDEFIVSKCDVNIMNTSIDLEEPIRPFMWSASPEIIGNGFWSEDNFFRMVDDDDRPSVKDMIEATGVKKQLKETKSSFVIYISPSTPVDDPPCDTGFSEDITAALLVNSSDRELLITSPMEIPIPW